MGKFVVPEKSRVWAYTPFMEAFLAAPGPCFALGFVEVQQRTCGFLAIRPDAILPPTVTAAGFRFGHSLQGTSRYTVVHFALAFYDFACYNALVRPDHPIVRTVLTRMVESGEFFFLALDAKRSVTAFNVDIGRDRHRDVAGLKHNLPRILRTETTEAQYQEALTLFRAQTRAAGFLVAVGLPRR
jgi:hypothetical protein